jgi:hypothetical protein
LHNANIIEVGAKVFGDSQGEGVRTGSAVDKPQHGIGDITESSGESFAQAGLEFVVGTQVTGRS